MARKFFRTLATSALFWLVFSLVLLTAVAGWEFIQWFLLEYWVFLLALASISAWALFRPGQKRARMAEQHEQSD